MYEYTSVLKEGGKVLPILNVNSLKMKKCCYCLSLTKGARLIGLVCLIITLGLFVSYLVFLEEVRRNVFETLYDFPPWCRRGENNFYLDMLIDSLFE